MDGISDEELVATFQESGEMRFLDELVHRHVNKVRAMVYPMVLNHTDTDDVTQEVFIRMVNGIKGFRQKSKFSTWLYRIAVNTVHSFLRRRSSRSMEYRAELPDLPDFAPAPDRAVMASETDARIEQALAHLSPSLRSAITLTIIQGVNIRDAARIEGCLAATMYWRVHEARKQIKRQLEGLLNHE